MDAASPVGGILRVTRGGRDLAFPRDTPPGQVWIYQGGFPFPMSPTAAGLFAGIRVCNTPIVDLEAGMDLVVFDRLENLDRQPAVPLYRIREEDHPRTGQRLFLVAGCQGGFVPLGARRPDGSPHPHAGTGFGLCSVMGYPAALKDQKDTHIDLKGDVYTFQELLQFSFDGGAFRVTARERFEPSDLLPGWNTISYGFTNAIPSGDDLLFPMSTGAPGAWDSGLARWRRNAAGRWRPVHYRLVAPATMEPTVVRDLDGSLLMAFRPWMPTHPRPLSLDIYRSADEGETWAPILREEKFNFGTPLFLNQAVDGTPYVITNRFREPPIHRYAKREMIWLWPLSEDRRRLLDPLVVRDGPVDFGPPPHGTVWRMDHPSGATVRLHDGQWHHVLGYRVLEDAEMRTGAGPTPVTGLYLEELFSAGTPHSAWNF